MKEKYVAPDNSFLKPTEGITEGAPVKSEQEKTDLSPKGEPCVL